MKPTKPVLKLPGGRAAVCNVVLAAAAAFACKPAAAFDRTWALSPPGVNWALPANWGGTAPLAGDSVFFGTSGTVVLNNDLPVNHVINGIAFNAGGSAFTLGGNAINLNGNLTNNSANPQSIGFPVGLQAATVTVAGGANVSIGGKITSGILGGIAGASRTLTNNLGGGSTFTLGNIDLSIDPDGAVRTLTFAGSGNTVITGVVANGSSAGGANNKLTHAGSGTLTLNGTAGSTYTGSTTVSSGALVLDYSNMATPANLLGLSNLTLGGSVVLTGKSAAATTQTFNGLTTVANRSSTFMVNQNGAISVGLTLGGLTRGAQSTTDFVLPATGTVTTSSANAANGIAASSAGTAYQAVGGTTWLAKTGAVAPYALSAFPEVSYSTSYAASSNVDVTHGDAPPAGTVNTLRFSGAPGKVLTFDGVNTVSSGGVLVTAAATGSVITGGTLRGNPSGTYELVLINHGSLEVASAIADSGGPSALTVAGSGTTTLSGNNTFTGAVSINQGATKIGTPQSGVVSSALGVGNAGAPAVTIATGATLDLNGFDQTVGTLATTQGTIRNNSGIPASLTVKSNGIQNGVIVTGTDLNLISDLGSGNQYQINNSLKTFSGTLTQRSGSIRTNAYDTDFGTARIILDVTAAGLIGTNGTFGGNNRLLVQNGTGSLPNDIQVDSAGFIANGDGSRTLSGDITGSGVLNVIDGSDTLTGDCSLFEGTFNLWQSATGVFINSTAASSALAKYTFSIEGVFSETTTSTYNANIPGGGTVHMGELSTTGATSNSRIRNNVNNTTATFSVGALDTDSTYGGVIVNGSGTAQITAFTKVGAGTLTLTGNSTHSGATKVEEGTLQILSPRSIAATSAVTVAAAGTLGGTGTFAGPVTAAGTVAPGTSVGTLSVGATVLTGTLAVEVDGALADKLVSTGNINLTGATLTVTVLAGGTQPSYVIAQGISRSGTFGTTNLPPGYSVTYSATQAILNRAGGGGYDTWKTLPANGLTATVNDGVNDDPDKDGIFNLLEFVFGGIPAGAAAADTSILASVALVPAVNPTALRVTFERADLSEGDVTLKVQWSTDLATWGAPDEVTIGAADAGIVDITEDSPTAALDTVAVSIPLTEALNGKLFARVSVTRP